MPSDGDSSRLARLTYVDSAGKHSDRLVFVLYRTTRANGLDAIVARDTRAGTTKTFRVDRIQSLVDIDTGEIIDATLIRTRID
jgi:predicted DNA-binding transcriptional regulator YafY